MKTAMATLDVRTCIGRREPEEEECYVMACHVMLCFVTLCYVMVCYFKLCYVCAMLHYGLLCYVYVMSCYVVRSRNFSMTGMVYLPLECGQISS